VLTSDLKDLEEDKSNPELHLNVPYTVLDLVLPDHSFSAKSLVIILLPAEIYQE
jgi:hypothetical protein